MESDTTSSSGILQTIDKASSEVSLYRVVQHKACALDILVDYFYIDMERTSKSNISKYMSYTWCPRRSDRKFYAHKNILKIFK